MDYGKLAYLKAEDLERQLSYDSGLKKRHAVTGYTVNTAFDLTLGDYGLKSFYGDGGISLIVKIVLRGDADSEGFVSLVVNGMELKKEKVKLTSGENKEKLLLGAINASGDNTLAIRTYGLDCTLTEASVLVSGDGCGISDALTPISAENIQDDYILITIENDYATVYCFNLSAVNFDNKKIIGDAVRVDITTSGGNFYAVRVDSLNNIFMVKLAVNGEVLSEKFLFNSDAEVAVGSDGKGVILAVTKDGATDFYMIPDDNEDCLIPLNAQLDTKTKRVMFVKNDKSPTLVVDDGERCFLKYVKKDYLEKQTVKIKLSCTLTRRV